MAFRPTNFTDITFCFEQATIRKKTGTLGEDDVAVRLTVGQEVRETEFQNDEVGPPIWKNIPYNVKVPEGVKTGLLQIFDESGDVVGSAELNFDDFMDVKEGEEVIQIQTLFQNKKLKQVATADLKYTYIIGKTANFQPRESMLKSSLIRYVRPKAGDSSLDRTKNSMERSYL